MSRYRCRSVAVVLSLVTFLSLGTALAADKPTRFTDDPHYTDVGFFDLHVCNWPDRKPFILGVFSTYKFNDVSKVEVFTPENKLLGEIPLEKYRLILVKGKPEKHAYLTQLELPDDAPNGWYSAHITMKDGKVVAAKDFVVRAVMPRPQNAYPVDHAEGVPMPKALTWDPVPGAAYYSIIIKDLWETTTVVDSKLLNEPRFEIPKGMLKPGGYYSWRIHARDVNENILLGDFNHGSLSPYMEFTIAE